MPRGAWKKEGSRRNHPDPMRGFVLGFFVVVGGGGGVVVGVVVVVVVGGGGGVCVCVCVCKSRRKLSEK